MDRILVVGDLYAELVLQELSAHPGRGREVFVSGARLRPGGAGVRVAAALKRLGRDVTLVAKVGRDDLGDSVLRELNGRVDYRGIRRDPRIRTGVTLSFSGEEEGSRVTFAGATTALTPRDLPSLDGYSHLHVASPFHLLGMPLASLLRKVRARKMTVSVAAGSDPRGPSPAEELLPLIDALFLNDAEARALGGGRRVAGKASLVVLRRGERGGVALTQGGEWKVRGVAAGPVFDAAFLDGWLAGHRVGEVLRYAVAASSLAAERDGDLGETPSRAEALHQVGRMSRGRTDR